MQINKRNTPALLHGVKKWTKPQLRACTDTPSPPAYAPAIDKF